MGFRMAGFGGNDPRDKSRGAGHLGRMAKGSIWNDANLVIDVDSYMFDGVVETGAPESVGISVPVVISIDDNDDDDEMEQDEECDFAEHPAGAPECFSEGSAQGRSSGNSPASNDMPTAANSVDDDCWVFEAKGRRAFNMSRCTKPNAAEGFSSNRYGFCCELESDSSDCEILEGSAEELREQWEKAFSRRKSCHGRSDVRDQSSPSSSHSHSDGDCGVGSSEKKNMESPESLNFENLNDEIGSFAFCFREDGLERGRGSANHNMADGFSKSFPKCKERSCSLGLNPKSREETAMYEEDNAHSTVETSREDYFRNGAHDDIEQATGAGIRMDDTELHKATDQSSTPGIRMDGIPRDIINVREKLKETNEYKQAVEQEWLARQQQLRIQAEEAQRLRKKKKAESLRALDMEKRQRQRLEEIRETQKKDEEHLNMKDQLRGVIRKELHMLEMTCFDMASLLRGLGIPIGFCPSSNEVRAAYKQALLKFHPDRVSTSDARQQVEAEEKFKLICRMKDKFLPAS